MGSKGDQKIGKYLSSTDYILKMIQSKAKEKSKDLKVLQTHQDDQFNCRSINSGMPELIYNSLFFTGRLSADADADGLILRNNIEYSSLVIGRQ